MNPVILFDGVCLLCNKFIQFIIKWDRNKKFQFAPLQSNYAQRALAPHALNGPPFSTVVLLKEGQIFTRSSAILHTLKELSFPWNLFWVFILIPPFIRNRIYEFIAANRYQWFGQSDTCPLPTPDLKERFHES